MINEKVAQKHELKAQINEAVNATKDRDEPEIKPNSCISNEDKNINPLKLLFDLENVKSMLRMMFKKRPNKARPQLILLNLCLVVYSIDTFGNFFYVYTE